MDGAVFQQDLGSMAPVTGMPLQGPHGKGLFLPFFFFFLLGDTVSAKQ